MGSYTEQDAVNRIWTLLRDYGQTVDEQLLTDDEIKDVGLRSAEQVYSRIVPLRAVDDLSADGSRFLAFAPTGWVEGFSTIESLESPPDEVPADLIDPRDYQIGLDGLGANRLVFVNDVPGNGDTVRVTFTVPRVIAASSANTTILDPDFSAFVDLAASICADAIAAKYARTSEPVISAETVNYRTRVQEWQSIAKRLWQRWEQQMGIGAGAEGGAAPAASAWANWDLEASWGGSHFNHLRANR